MGELKQIKLNHLLKSVPNNAIITTKWLNRNNIANNLISKYIKSGWIKSVGKGAYIKLNDTYGIDSAIYALQQQLNLSIHIGGISALNDKYNIRHNLSFNDTIFLYAPQNEIQPVWFKSIFKDKYTLIRTNFLPVNLGIESFNNKLFDTKISSVERAVFEMLYLVPDTLSLYEVYQILETLTVLKVNVLQKLLEKCTSIKVKRLFLYMADKLNYPWFKKLKLNKIDLGSGKRIITKGAKLNKKYNIVVEDLTNL